MKQSIQEWTKEIIWNTAFKIEKTEPSYKDPLASDAPALGEEADATYLIANNLPKTFFHFPKFQK